MQLFVSTKGNDTWSGTLAEPNTEGTDGPLASIAGAQIMLRKMQVMQHREWNPRPRIATIDLPIHIQMRGGRYELERPVTFTPNDLPMVIEPYGDEKVELSGGMTITGWEETTVNGVTAWKTTVPQVAAGRWYFKQLFVNDKRATRSRWPKEGFFHITKPGVDANGCEQHGWGKPGTNHFSVNEGEFDSSWRNQADIHAVVLHYWIDERMPVVKYDESTRTIHSNLTSRAPLSISWDAEPAPFFIDNVFEKMTEPGDWYLDRQTGECWYVPHEGEAIETADIVAPRLHQLVRFEGDPQNGKLVEHINLRGVTICHSEWAMKHDEDVDQKYFQQIDPRAMEDVHLASGPQSACIYSGAVYVRGVKHCAIEDCTIQHTGWYGVDIVEGTTQFRFVGNEITDTGAGAMKINGGAANEPMRELNADPAALRTGYLRITDNHVHHGGQVFIAGMGILLRHANACLIAHNHIHDFYYSGISAGWVWGYGESVSQNNIIEYNHIHDLGKGWLSDMGGVYLLGVSPGTVVRNNCIHDVKCLKYGGWAIYPDEGASHIIIENNVCYRTSNSSFHQHYGRENVVRNNIWAFGNEALIALGKAAEHNSFTLTNNIMLADNQPIYGGGYGWQVDSEHKAAITASNLVWDIATPGKVTAAANKQHGTDSDLNAEGLDWSTWQANGNDLHSQMADPMFKDPANGDFTLADNSPALAIGFKPIDLSTVGPRPKGERD